MGCDIHIFIEKKTDQGWKEVEIEGWLIPDGRNYALFGFLSHVRGSYEGTEAMDLGWPEDSELKDDWRHDHYHTYLKDIYKWDWPEDLKDNYFKVFFEYIIPRHPELEFVKDKDIRLLVCYDS